MVNATFTTCTLKKKIVLVINTELLKRKDNFAQLEVLFEIGFKDLELLPWCSLLDNNKIPVFQEFSNVENIFQIPKFPKFSLGKTKGYQVISATVATNDIKSFLPQ